MHYRVRLILNVIQKIELMTSIMTIEDYLLGFYQFVADYLTYIMTLATGFIIVITTFPGRPCRMLSITQIPHTPYKTF